MQQAASHAPGFGAPVPSAKDTINPIQEMHRQHPHLSMGQIHAALAYYYEHQDEVDADIERQTRYVEEMRAQQKNPFTREELLRRREAQEKRQ